MSHDIIINLSKVMTVVEVFEIKIYAFLVVSLFTFKILMHAVHTPVAPYYWEKSSRQNPLGSNAKQESTLWIYLASIIFMQYW